MRHLGHDVTEVDVDKDLTRALESADAVFVALHGRDGEDGNVQLVCEGLGVPYTGSAPLTCRFCFDKGLAKGILNHAGLPTPPAFVLPVEAIRHMGAGTALRRAATAIGYPLIVKPTAQGSALGLTVVDEPDELSAAALAAFSHGDRILLERFVSGTDVSVALHGTDLSALPAVEIRTGARVFDFETRVSPGAFELICPTDASDDITLALAINTAKTLGVRDFARVDMRIGDDGPTVLDVKTCPGLTETSIVPFAAQTAGLAFEDVVGAAVDAAFARATQFDRGDPFASRR